MLPTFPILEGRRRAQKAAEQIGYPVLIKASAGGRRQGHSPGRAPLRTWSRPSRRPPARRKKPLGTAACTWEKYLDLVKHIEVQLLADEEGTSSAWASGVLYPSGTTRSSSGVPLPAVTPELRARLMDTAARAAPRLTM